MIEAIAKHTTEILGCSGIAASATRVGGGRASEVFRVQGQGFDVIAYWLTYGGVREARRRFTTLERLADVFPMAPKPLAVTNIGETGLLLVERLEGIIPASHVSFTGEEVSRLAKSFITALAQLHTLKVPSSEQSPDYLSRVLVEWKKRWSEKEATESENKYFRSIMQWLSEHIPKNLSCAMLHNDYKLDNILVDPGDPTRISGIIDWELASIGYPLADLGIALSYWVEEKDPSLLKLESPGPSYLAGAPSRDDLVNLYEAITGRRVAKPIYWYVYGMLRLIVITQQLAIRGQKEQRQMPRAKMIISLLLRRAIKSCRIDGLEDRLQ